jgi:ATP synthase protein I
MATERTPPDGGETGGRPGQVSPEEQKAFKARADEIGRRLEAAKGQSSSGGQGRTVSGTESAANASALNAALKVSTELIGGIAVGSGLGWLLDHWLGTWPGFFVAGFLLGSAAGMLNVVRTAGRMKTGPSNPAAGPAVKDDDDDN